MGGLFGSTGLIEIGRVNDGPVPGFKDIRVDRQTIFGNKFPISQTGSRAKSCKLYADWAERRMKARKNYWYRVMQLRKMHQSGINLRLLCHCWPKQCHAQTIRKLIMRVQ